MCTNKCLLLLNKNSYKKKYNCVQIISFDRNNWNDITVQIIRIGKITWSYNSLQIIISHLKRYNCYKIINFGIK